MDVPPRACVGPRVPVTGNVRRQQEPPSMKDILKDVVVLALGWVGGYLVSAHFHRRQASEKEPTDRRITDALEKIYHQAVRNGAKGSSILYTLEKKRAHYANENDLVEIKGKLDQLAVTIANSNLKQGSAVPVEEVLEYKALGDRWSELVAHHLNLRVLDDDGRISIQRLLSAHKSLFPDGYAWAGTYRRQAVFVVDTFGTAARIVDVAVAENRVATIAPEAIVPNLTRLFEHWNNHVAALKLASSDRKIDEIVHFHHEFQLIHPFLDGNGRIGRMMLEEQLSLLFGQKVTFRPKREEYLRGLRLLDMGEADAFRGLIRTELAKFHVDL